MNRQRDAPSRGMLRLLGGMKVNSDWSYLANRVVGVDNVVTDMGVLFGSWI